MFQRFVFIKLKAEWTNADGCREVIESARKVLPTIPGVQECYAGQPADAEAAKGWDLCLMLRFATLEDIERYRIHPDHQAFLENVLAPRVEAKRVWNFDMQGLSQIP